MSQRSLKGAFVASAALFGFGLVSEAAWAKNAAVVVLVLACAGVGAVLWGTQRVSVVLWLIGMAAGAAFVMQYDWDGPVALHTHDAWLAAGIALVTASLLVSVRGQERRRIVLDLLVLTGAMTCVGFVIAAKGLAAATGSERMVGAAIVVGSATNISVLYRLGAEDLSERAAHGMTLIGMVLMYGGNVGYVALNGSTVTMRPLWLTWSAGIALMTAGMSMARPDIDERQAHARRTLISVFSVLVAIGAGAAASSMVPKYPALAFVAVPTIALAAGLAVTRVRQARIDRATSAAALEREVLLRDLERRDMTRLLHDYVLQLLVAAAWLSPDAATGREVAVAEAQLRSLLTSLRGTAAGTTEA